MADEVQEPQQQPYGFRQMLSDIGGSLAQVPRAAMADVQQAWQHPLRTAGDVAAAAAQAGAFAPALQRMGLTRAPAAGIVEPERQAAWRAGTEVGEEGARVLRQPSTIGSVPEGYVTDPARRALLYLGAGKPFVSDPATKTMLPGELPYIEYGATEQAARGEGAMSNLIMRALKQAGGWVHLGSPRETGPPSEGMRGVLANLIKAGAIEVRQLPSGRHAARLLMQDFPFSPGTVGP